MSSARVAFFMAIERVKCLYVAFGGLNGPSRANIGVENVIIAMTNRLIVGIIIVAISWRIKLRGEEMSSPGRARMWRAAHRQS